MLLISSGVDSSTALTVTFATGLAVICVTMINSSYCHYKNKMIITQYLKPMMIFGFIGAICGAIVAQYIDTSLLKVFFGIICIISIAFIIALKPPSDTSHIKKGEMLFCSISFLGGLLSGLVGPAGGAILIPIFIAYLKYPLKNTIGTTSILTIPTTFGGVLAYVILGWGQIGLPDYSLGYVNILQFVFLTITSVLISSHAANLAKKIDKKYLTTMQVLVISYIGLKMIGIV